MGERELPIKTYDHQDMIAVTTLGADGAPLDGPEIAEGIPIARPTGEAVSKLKPVSATGLGSRAQAAK